jgi:hypothetical protein
MTDVNISVDNGAGTDYVPATDRVIDGDGTRDYQLVKLVDATEDSTTRTGTGGAPLRVDPTGSTAQPVTDNGGSLTVDGEVSLSGGTISVAGTVPVTFTGGTVTVQDGGGTLAVEGSVTADTELPDAAALSDNQANPTTPTVGAALLAFDGTTWDRVRTGLGDAGSGLGLLASLAFLYNGTTYDRLRGDVTNGLDVDVTRVGGTVTVDGSGVTQPVSGTLSVGGTVPVTNTGGTLNVGGTVAVSSIAAGDNNIGNVDVVTLPALPAGNNNIGDVDVASLPALAAGTNTIGVVRNKESTGTLDDAGTDRTVKYAIIDAASSGDNTLLAAVASRKIRVLSAFLVSSGSVNVRFESGAAGTALTGQMNLVANTGFVLPYTPHGWFETAVNTLLNLELSAAVSVDGSFTYVEVA